MTELDPKATEVREHYADVMDWLESLGVRPRVFREGMVLRFRRNEIVEETREEGTMDLNRICARWYRAPGQRAEYYTLIGYSLSGFAEIFSDELDEFTEAKRAEAE